MKTVRIVVVNGEPTGGIQRPKVDKGDRVVVVVRSDVADEVHIHGYDVMKDVAAGKTVRIPFTATIPGRFEVELENLGLQLAEITVNPLNVVAHGIGGVRDLPIPLWLLLWSAAVVLVVSFIALGSLWKRPLLARHAGGTALGETFSRVVLGPLRIVLQVVAAALFGLVWLAALVGEHRPAAQPGADVGLRHLLAGRARALGRVRKRLAGPLPVARSRGRVRLGLGTGRT